MGDLQKNIDSSEVRCKCGSPDCTFTILDDEPVLAVWQGACDHFARKLGVDKVVLVVHSGARCTEYNRKIGSNDNSQHPRGRAIDGHIVGVTINDLANYFEKKYPQTFGIGRYGTFVHCDTRVKRARWNG